MDTISSTQLAEERISDFGLVAALVTSGFSIRRTEREGSRVYFIFENTNSLKLTTDAYWGGNLKVYARQLNDNNKMLKSLIYSSGGI